MKVAVCISGFSRGIEACIPTWEKFLIDKSHQMDAFICSGPSIEYTNARPINHLIPLVQPLFTNTIWKTEESIWEMNIPPIIEERNFNNRNKQHVMSMFHKIKTVNDMKREYEVTNGFRYDVVVRWRPDTYLRTPIEIIREDKWFVPKHGDFGGLNDQMAWSTSENMDFYSTLYDQIVPYLQQDSSLTFNPELLLRRHWQKSGKALQRPAILYQLARDNVNMLPDNETRERIMRESNGTRNL